MALLYIDPQTWQAASHQNMASWDEAVTPKAAVDTLTPVITEVSLVKDLKSASDTATVIVTDTGQPPVITGIESKAGSDTLTPIITEAPGDIHEVTVKTASDTLTPVITENRQLADVQFSLHSASDTLTPVITEAPTTARLSSTDDVLTPTTTETAVQPQQDKFASDTLVPIITEFWEIAPSDAEVPIVASDTLLVGIVDTAIAIAQDTVITAADTLVPVITETALVAPDFVEVAASDTLVPVISETAAVFELIAIAASDTLLVVCDDTSRSISIFEAPPVGVLPPGWLELEITELAGIARPWRIEPRNVTPTQGWMPRKYWAVYDDRGNLVATDRWRDVARAKAWTHYHAGRWAA